MTEPARAAESVTARVVDRALDARARAASAEVERILTAAVTVIQRVEPASPRVADILAEAGSSNQAFYRYFASKDDLILAVMERGVAILRSYLEHKLAKETDPVARVQAWIHGILAQTDDPTLARQTRAVSRQTDALASARPGESLGFRTELLALLHPALVDAGVADPAYVGDAIYDVTFGALGRHVFALSPVPPGERDQLVRFCLNGCGLKPITGRKS